MDTYAIAVWVLLGFALSTWFKRTRQRLFVAITEIPRARRVR